jgi:hypothetical protein
LGDVQRLYQADGFRTDGNTVIGYSAQGVLHEVDAQGNMVQVISFPRGFGYFNKRPSLYGPPVR